MVDDETAIAPTAKVARILTIIREQVVSSTNLLGAIAVQSRM